MSSNADLEAKYLSIQEEIKKLETKFKELEDSLKQVNRYGFKDVEKCEYAIGSQLFVRKEGKHILKFLHHSKTVATPSKKEMREAKKIKEWEPCILIKGWGLYTPQGEKITGKDIDFKTFKEISLLNPKKIAKELSEIRNRIYELRYEHKEIEKKIVASTGRCEVCLSPTRRQPVVNVHGRYMLICSKCEKHPGRIRSLAKKNHSPKGDEARRGRR